MNDDAKVPDFGRWLGALARDHGDGQDHVRVETADQKTLGFEVNQFRFERGLALGELLFSGRCEFISGYLFFAFAKTFLPLGKERVRPF